MLQLGPPESFYDATGTLDEAKLRKTLDSTLLAAGGKMRQVVGWFKFRRNSSLQPTLREQAVHAALARFVEREKRLEKQRDEQPMQEDGDDGAVERSDHAADPSEGDPSFLFGILRTRVTDQGASQTLEFSIKQRMPAGWVGTAPRFPISFPSYVMMPFPPPVPSPTSSSFRAVTVQIKNLDKGSENRYTMTSCEQSALLHQLLAAASGGDSGASSSQQLADGTACSTAGKEAEALVHTLSERLDSSMAALADQEGAVGELADKVRRAQQRAAAKAKATAASGAAAPGPMLGATGARSPKSAHAAASAAKARPEGAAAAAAPQSSR